MRNQKLAAKLREIRVSLGLTQHEMVQILKNQKPRLTVYPGNISRFEQGLREPPLLVLLAYARVARTTIDVLVDDDLDLPGSGKHRPSGIMNTQDGIFIECKPVDASHPVPKGLLRQRYHEVCER